MRASQAVSDLQLGWLNIIPVHASSLGVLQELKARTKLHQSQMDTHIVL